MVRQFTPGVVFFLKKKEEEEPSASEVRTSDITCLDEASIVQPQFLSGEYIITVRVPFKFEISVSRN